MHDWAKKIQDDYNSIPEFYKAVELFHELHCRQEHDVECKFHLCSWQGYLYNRTKYRGVKKAWVLIYIAATH